MSGTRASDRLRQCAAVGSPDVAIRDDQRLRDRCARRRGRARTRCRSLRVVSTRPRRRSAQANRLDDRREQVARHVRRDARRATERAVEERHVGVHAAADVEVDPARARPARLAARAPAASTAAAATRGCGRPPRGGRTRLGTASWIVHVLPDAVAAPGVRFWPRPAAPAAASQHARCRPIRADVRARQQIRQAAAADRLLRRRPLLDDRRGSPRRTARPPGPLGAPRVVRRRSSVRSPSRTAAERRRVRRSPAVSASTIGVEHLLATVTCFGPRRAGDGGGAAPGPRSRVAAGGASSRSAVLAPRRDREERPIGLRPESAHEHRVDHRVEGQVVRARRRAGTGACAPAARGAARASPAGTGARRSGSAGGRTPG